MKMEPRNSCECEHDFVLVLGGIHELTQQVEDGLFEAGCDDATLSVRQGRVLLTFSRQGASLKDAIFSAIRDVNSSGIGAKVLRVDDCNLVTQSDIARRIGYSRQVVNQYISGARGGGGFPGPICHIVEGAPLWRWCEVSYWLWKKGLIREDVLRIARETEMINGVLELESMRQESPELLEEVMRHVTGRIPATAE
jgi:hypothetical protein